MFVKRTPSLFIAGLFALVGTLPADADYTLTLNKTDNKGMWDSWGCSLAW